MLKRYGSNGTHVNRTTALPYPCFFFFNSNYVVYLTSHNSSWTTRIHGIFYQNYFELTNYSGPDCTASRKNYFTIISTGLSWRKSEVRAFFFIITLGSGPRLHIRYTYSDRFRPEIHSSQAMSGRIFFSLKIIVILYSSEKKSDPFLLTLP